MIRSFLAVLVLLALVGDLSAAEAVKVFVLTGQSNMEGKGLPTHLDTYKDEPGIKEVYGVLKRDGRWTERDDVWITYPTKAGGAKQGPLTVGYGTKGEDSIGPEFGFGHTVGESLDGDVVIVKVAWGGKSLAVDFRPPSAGLPSEEKLTALLERRRKKNPKTTPEDVEKSHGHYYRELVRHTKSAVENLGKTFPDLAGREVEIAGIVWHQGFNDKINGELRAAEYADYTKWLQTFVKDLRRDLGAPNAPFVIGELSTGGIPSRGSFQKAQAAAADLPEFEGNVRFVPTAEYYDTKAHELYTKGFWKGTEEQKAQWRAVGNDRPYHYLGSGKTYFLKGQAFGEAMLDMLDD